MNIPPWIRHAYSTIGIHEGIGSTNNLSVVKYYTEAMHPEIHQDSVPWCAAFVASMLHRAGVRNDVPDAMKLWAPSYARLGVQLAHPVFGCIGVLQHHVTFIVGDTGSAYLCLGGNQSDQVDIASFRKSAFMAYRWPPGVPVPPPDPLPTNVATIKQIMRNGA